MPATNFSNGGYEKVSLLDEFDENDIFFKNASIAETKANGNNTHTFEFSVSVSSLTNTGIEFQLFQSANRYWNR